MLHWLASKCSQTLESVVVYFDQQMGASHAVCWLESSFSAFFHVFSSHMEKKKKTCKKINTRGPVHHHQVCYMYTTKTNTKMTVTNVYIKKPTLTQQ